MRAQLDAGTRRRLVDLLPRLASDQTGEVIATAAAIVRVLKSAGLDLHDVAAIIADSAIDQVPTDDEPRRSDPISHRADALRALAEVLWRSERERLFLENVAGFFKISPAQRRWLDAILARGNV